MKKIILLLLVATLLMMMSTTVSIAADDDDIVFLYPEYNPLEQISTQTDIQKINEYTDGFIAISSGDAALQSQLNTQKRDWGYTVVDYFAGESGYSTTNIAPDSSIMICKVLR